MTSLYGVVRTVVLVTTTEFSAPVLKSARIRAGCARAGVFISYFRHCDIITCACDIEATLSADVFVIHSHSPTHSSVCGKLFVYLNHGSAVELRQSHVMRRHCHLH